jgi:tRNA A37 threonylcarbamoyladenosine modification protein TsaB
MDKLKGKYILALETAIDGGSISILSDNNEIDFVKGNQNLSKSEDLLTLLDDLLSRNNILKSQIGLVTISIGAGSLTGLRIGKAIALGISNSLNISLLEISLFDALRPSDINVNNLYLVVYAGKDKVLCQENRNIASDKFLTLPLSDFVDKYNTWKMTDNAEIILSENLRPVLPENEWEKIALDSQTHIIWGNLSKITGLRGKFLFESDND